MRRAAEFATAGDKIGGVKVLVATYGAATPDIFLDHVERGGAFSAAVGLGQSRIDDESTSDHGESRSLLSFNKLSGYRP